MRLFLIIFSTCLINIFALKFSLAAPIHYLTDLEGSRAKLEAFYKESGGFDLGTDGLWHLKKGHYFVYGGDAVDRFEGSQWIVRELIRHKKENPDFVSLILGNRELNKIRIPSELSKDALKAKGRKFWFTKESAWEATTANDTRVERLEYIFKESMGAPKAFELRRNELISPSRPPWAEPLRKELEQRFNRKVEFNDSEFVVESFLHELRPGNDFHQLLEMGELVQRVENTLFVHGGLSSEAMGWVPGTRKTQKINDVNEWIKAVNAAYRKSLRTWSSSWGEWTPDKPNPTEELVEYALPLPGKTSKPESLITSRAVDQHNNPLLPEPAVMEWLLSQGINRLVYGHTPTGDIPVVLRTADGRFEVVVGDNSYSQIENNVSVVRFDGKKTDLAGKYKDAAGVIHPFKLEETLELATVLGQRAADGSIILSESLGKPGLTFRMEKFENYYIQNSGNVTGSEKDCETIFRNVPEA